MRKTYRIVRIDDCTRNEYTTTNKDALKAARKIGRANTDIIFIYDGDRAIDCAFWTKKGYKRPRKNWRESYLDLAPQN